MTLLTEDLVAEARHARPVEDVVTEAGVMLWRTAGWPAQGSVPVPQ